MKIVLTRAQVAKLAPYLDRVRAAGALGNPGMLVGQIRHNSYRDAWTIEPCFLDHHKALPLVEAGKREIPG